MKRKRGSTERRPCLQKEEARKLASELLARAAVGFTRHALEEMQKDKLTTVDVTNVLRGGHIYSDGEMENGSCRYRVETMHMTVVVALAEDPPRITVITAWRKRR